MLAAELIRHKRADGELSAEQIDFLVAGLTDGSLSDAQAGALAMAIVWRGMTAAERVALTGAMTRSGDVLQWSDAGLGDRPVLDKHSTGGVGDKVSLLLAPIVAACGGAVPMISGRGLGHTGGTLDKLQSIPGYDVAPDDATFRAAVRNAGCAIIGQTGTLAPADKRLYAIRDATGTVESIPLITASILSKKLAAGLDALVMDVKVGSGAFMPGHAAARELAQAIVEVAQGNGMPTSALITDMDRVLGRAAGNAVEVRESIDHLTGAASDERLRAVTLALSAELLRLGGIDADPAHALDSGAAAERFATMVSELGGPRRPARAARSPPARGAGDDRGVPRRGRHADRGRRPGGRHRDHRPRRRPGAGDRRHRPQRRADARSPLPASASAPVSARWPSSTRATSRAAARAADELRAACTIGDGAADHPRPDPGGPAVIPKAELHVHLEGTAPPELIGRLAQRNGLEVPLGLLDDAERFSYTDFLDFLRAYDTAASVIRTAEDYRDITYEYLRSCAEEGAIYVELTASPDHAALVGLSDEEHLGGIAQGIDDARAHGIEGRILISAVRNFGVEQALRVARHAAELPHPYVVGFSMAGDEAGHPPGPFAEAFEIAAAAGLGCTCHAGEWAGPESVRAAMELPITRISHGVRAIEDPELVEEIAERGLVLECCPTSNIVLGIYPSYAEHPLPQLVEAGVRVTLGSDDPPYFGATIGGEYKIAAEELHFGQRRPAPNHTCRP